MIALVTYAADPGLTPDDALLQRALAHRGIEAVPVPWDARVDWSTFDLVVIRSAWDYFLRPSDFATWIDRLEADGATVINEPAVIRWNSDKRYLIELERDGADIVPTHVVARGDAPPQLGEVLALRSWPDAVVKPSISAGAHETWRTSASSAEADQDRFEALVAGTPGSVLVQPFVPEVVSDGEWSLVFLDGEFSHAAIKRPRPGDFRVQHVHGGAYEPASASTELVEQAERVVEIAARRAGIGRDALAYARVDGIARKVSGRERLVVMELECIEPSLFFLQAPEAADRMAASLDERIAARRRSGT